MLWLVCEVIQDPGCEPQLVPHKCRLYSVKSTGEIKQYDPHSASRLFPRFFFSFIEASLCGAFNLIDVTCLSVVT